MNSPDHIRLYWQAIQSGEAVVGRWVRLFYAYVIAGLDAGQFFYDERKARRAVLFIETFCHHCKGRNDLLVLELWQRAAVCVIFGIVGADGLRQFREVLIVVARKNGKTLFAAAIVAYVLFLDGEYGAEIFCVAPKLDQADLVYSSFWQTIEAEPELQELIKRRKSDFYVESTNSQVKKIAFNAKKSDGFNGHLIVCDEIASWPGQSGLKQYEVLRSSQGSRSQPLLLSISTAGYENEGIYDELMKRSTRFLLGDSRETRLAPILYMVDDPEKWNDMQELRKANPNLGVSVSEEFYREEIAIAEQSLSKKTEFLTKYCCVKQSSSSAWLSATAVERASGTALDLNDFRHCYCVGGIDLSKTTDLTACSIVVERAGRLYVFARFFMPADRIELNSARDNVPYQAYVERGLLIPSGDSFVDYRDCFNWFRDLVEAYQIYPLKVGYDRYCASYLVQDMKAYGFHMDDVYQGYNLTPVLNETEGLINDGVIDIGDNDLLKIHLLDTALQRDSVNGRCRMVKISSQAHIDGAAAVVDALTVRQKWYQDIGAQLRNERQDK